MKNILVLGSKPSSILPNVHPDVVISANGAVARLKDIQCEKKIAVISTGALSDAFAVENVRSSDVDEVVIRGHKREHDFILDLNKEMKFINGVEMAHIEYKFYGN